MVDIAQAAAMLSEQLNPIVPAHSRSMMIVNSWVDAGEGQPKKLVREIHVAFRSPFSDKPAPSEIAGHPVRKVGFQP